jgi:hypothetical protein
METLRDIGQFIVAVVSHWQAYVTGGVVTGLVSVGERLTGKTLPNKVYAAVFLGFFLLVSFFLAWDDEYRRSNKLQADLGAKPALPFQVNVPQGPAPQIQVKKSGGTPSGCFGYACLRLVNTSPTRRYRLRLLAGAAHVPTTSASKRSWRPFTHFA